MDLSNRRQYFRADISVPVRWRVLTGEETRLARQGMAHSLLRKASVPSPIDEFIEEAIPGSKEEQLYRCLQLINNKLDFVIEQVFLRSAQAPPSKDEVIDMSGSGLKFTCREHMQHGTLLKMDLIMPGTFQYQMELISEVMRVEAKEGGFIVAAKIVEIEEGCRESIVKVVFQKQRKDIREGKSALEDRGAV
jgi:c-di-GMP-binding flagellar brake protein YcgR